MTTQLDLFAPAPTPTVPSWAEQSLAATCGKCLFFYPSAARARLGLDGYCSFHAFEDDPRPDDGTGWHFYNRDQACTVTA